MMVTTIFLHVALILGGMLLFNLAGNSSDCRSSPPFAKSSSPVAFAVFSVDSFLNLVQDTVNKSNRHKSTCKSM